MSEPSGHEKHVSASQDDELDEWDARIQRGGCMQEHLKLQDCYLDTKDWRKCKDEVFRTSTSLSNVDGSIQTVLGTEGQRKGQVMRFEEKDWKSNSHVFEW
jgi:cytochrome c oxidase assembly factor 4